MVMTDDDGAKFFSEILKSTGRLQRAYDDSTWINFPLPKTLDQKKEFIGKVRLQPIKANITMLSVLTAPFVEHP